ncbi:MAG: hypothetical protein IT291_04790 [Deltaproteobacteria bacterium]|nr:hypothetical protein [Deltaproteobacteria bacterium]
MVQNAIDSQIARKIEERFLTQTTLKRLRLNFAEFEQRSPIGWIADTSTSTDGGVVFGALINALFSGTSTQSVQLYYHHPIVDGLKNAFTNEAQARKNQEAINLLRAWKKRNAITGDNSWELVKAEIEDAALSDRRRFEK